MVADQRPGLIRVGGLVFLTIALAASIALADFCPKCGKEIDATDNFCRKCGKNLKSSEEPKQEGAKEKAPEERQSQQQSVVIVIQKDGKTCVKGDQEGTQKPPAPVYQATFSFHQGDYQFGSELLSGKLSGRNEEVSLGVRHGLNTARFDVSVLRTDDTGRKSLAGPSLFFDLQWEYPAEELNARIPKPYTQAAPSLEVKQDWGYRFVLRVVRREWSLLDHVITHGELRVYPDSVGIETEKSR